MFGSWMISYKRVSAVYCLTEEVVRWCFALWLTKKFEDSKGFKTRFEKTVSCYFTQMTYSIFSSEKYASFNWFGWNVVFELMRWLSFREKRRPMFIIRTHKPQHSPVLGLDPAGQTLTDVHGEVIIIKIVHMFQESDLQLLNLLPLAHPAVHTKQIKSSCAHRLSRWSMILLLYDIYTTYI